MAGYGDDTAFTAWLAAQGLTLPVGAPTPAVLRQRGADYLDATYEPMLSCSKRTGSWSQERAWPRAGHAVGGETLPDDLIPQPWVNASYRAAWLEASSPGWASGSIDPNRKTKREKVDTLEREFFSPTDTAGGTGAVGNVDAAIQGMVSIFFCPDAEEAGALALWAIGS